MDFFSMTEKYVLRLITSLTDASIRNYFFLNVYINVCMYVYINVCMCMCLCLCMYVCVHLCLCMYVCMCVFVSVYVCMHVYVCVCGKALERVNGLHFLKWLSLAVSNRQVICVWVLQDSEFRFWVFSTHFDAMYSTYASIIRDM